jgi:hypothetical protein
VDAARDFGVHGFADAVRGCEHVGETAADVLRGVLVGRM